MTCALCGHEAPEHHVPARELLLTSQVGDPSSVPAMQAYGGFDRCANQHDCKHRRETPK